MLAEELGYEDVDEWYAVATGRAKGHIYSRNTNPTVRAFEQKAQALEGADDAIAFSSGMAAISNRPRCASSVMPKVLMVRT